MHGSRRRSRQRRVYGTNKDLVEWPSGACEAHGRPRLNDEELSAGALIMRRLVLNKSAVSAGGEIHITS